MSNKKHNSPKKVGKITKSIKGIKKLSPKDLETASLNGIENLSPQDLQSSSGSSQNSNETSGRKDNSGKAGK